MSIQPELVKYIQQFEKYANECRKKGTIQIFMLYKYECQTCQMEFNHFKNYLGISFDGDMTQEQRKNFEMIACRLLPINADSKLGMDLIKESIAWAEKVGDPDLEIKFSPTYLDAITHKKVAYGFIPERPLKDMLNLNNLPRRRREFQQTYTEKMNEPCDAVACGMKSRVKVRGIKEKKGR